MPTLRKADVKCPKCGHGFAVRDNGGLTKTEADRKWKALDEACAAMDRAAAKFDKIFP